MNLLKLAACMLLGVLAAFVGVVISPGPIGAAWIGLVLGVAIVAVGSMISGELCGLEGYFLYVVVVFICTVWLIGFTPSNDMLIVPAELAQDAVVDAWPLIVLVAALVPAYIADARSARSDV